MAVSRDLESLIFKNFQLGANHGGCPPKQNTLTFKSPSSSITCYDELRINIDKNNLIASRIILLKVTWCAKILAAKYLRCANAILCSLGYRTDQYATTGQITYE